MQRNREFFDGWSRFTGVTDGTGVNLTRSQHVGRSTREIQDKESDAGRGDKERGEMVDEDTFRGDNGENIDGENGDEGNSLDVARKGGVSARMQ